MKFTVDPCDVSAYEDSPLLTLDDGIMLVEAFSPNMKPWGLDCESLLSQIKGCERGQSGVYDRKNTEVVNDYHRSSSYLMVPQDIRKKVMERLDFVVKHHLGDRFELCEELSFLCYDEANSGHFNRHTDNAYWDNGEFLFTSPRRKLTTVTYLNDDYEGGEIVFDTVHYPNGDIFNHKIPKGSMVMFPSDLRFPHEVKPVTKGQRYSIVAWYDFK